MPEPVDMNDTTRAQIQSLIRSSPTTDWTYLAEGGAHLVFSYCGNEPSIQNKVLRIRKTHLEPRSGNDTGAKPGRYECARNYLATTITPSLVPPELLPMECKVTLNAEWVHELERGSLDLRPKERISSRRYPSNHQHSTSPTSFQASLVENLLGGEGDIAIEIKVSYRY